MKTKALSTEVTPTLPETFLDAVTTALGPDRTSSLTFDIDLEAHRPTAALLTGGVLLLGWANGRVRGLDVVTGRRTCVLDRPGGSVSALARGPGASVLVGYSDGKIWQWSIEASSVEHTPNVEGSGGVRYLAVTPDGHLLVLQDRLRLCSLGTGRTIQTYLRDEYCLSAFLVPDAERPLVAVSGSGRRLLVVHLRSGRVVQEHTYENWVNALLYTSHLLARTSDGVLWQFDPWRGVAPKALRRDIGWAGQVTRVEANDNFLVLAGEDRLDVWDRVTETATVSRTYPASLAHAERLPIVEPDMGHVLTAHIDGYIRRSSLIDPQREPFRHPIHLRLVESMHFDETRNCLLICDGVSVREYDLERGRVTPLLEAAPCESIGITRFSPCGTRLVCQIHGPSARVELWDLVQRRSIVAFPGTCANRLGFVGAKEQFFSTDTQGEVLVRDAQTSSPPYRCELPSKTVTCVAPSRSGSLLAVSTCDDRGSLHVIDLERRELVRSSVIGLGAIAVIFWLDDEEHILLWSGTTISRYHWPSGSVKETYSPPGGATESLLVPASASLLVNTSECDLPVEWSVEVETLRAPPRASRVGCDPRVWITHDRSRGLVATPDGTIDFHDLRRGVLLGRLYSLPDGFLATAEPNSPDDARYFWTDRPSLLTAVETPTGGARVRLSRDDARGAEYLASHNSQRWVRARLRGLESQRNACQDYLRVMTSDLDPGVRGLRLLR